MKQAQSTQVYIVVGVIVFFGVVFGFKVVYDFLNTSKEMQIVDFQTQLKADAKVISSKPASVQHHTYVLPNSVQQLCIYDKEAPGSLPASIMIKSMIDEGKNVFLIGDKVSGARVDYISAPSRYFCINTSRDSVDIYLEGKGGSALVRPG